MAPAARLFARLGYPSLSDTALRQYLLILYRKMYNAEGQRAAAAKAAGNATRAGSGGGTGGGDVGIAGVQASSTNQDSSDGGGSSGDLESDPDQPFGPKRRKALPPLQRSNSSGGQAVRPEGPQLTSQQELLLFMRWLNLTYDAMNKVQQVKDSEAAAQPSATPTPAPAPATAAVTSTGKGSTIYEDVVIWCVFSAVLK